MKGLPLSTRRGFSIDSLESDKDFPTFPSLKSGERTAEEYKHEHRKVISNRTVRHTRAAFITSETLIYMKKKLVRTNSK